MSNILPGQRFNRLVTVFYFTKKTPKGKSYGYWSCQCDCGKTSAVRADSLKRRVSCGCTTALKTHGMTDSKTYTIWQAMKSRCNNPKNNRYYCYGGRGIKVCKSWNESFEAFYADMGSCPSGCSIDRIDNSKGYYKENCKWSTKEEQANNKTNNSCITFNGETKTISQWSKETGIRSHAIARRLREYGWTPEQALTVPSGNSGRKPNTFWES